MIYDRTGQKEEDEDAPSVVTHSILDLWATYYLCATHTGCRFSVVHLYGLLTCTLDRRNHKIAFECLTFVVDLRVITLLKVPSKRQVQSDKRRCIASIS